jgi:heterodisulfide reductase subunit B2
MARVAYYPGCSLQHSAEEFGTTSRMVLEALGVGLIEVPDWTCCGSSPAHMTDHLLAQALAARNLRQAALVSSEMVAPCPSCYQREKNAEVEIDAVPGFRVQVNSVLDTPYEGHVHVYNLVEALSSLVGEEAIAKRVNTDLSQLRVVPYYGCLLARPSELTGECDNEQPMMMDRLLEAVGCDVRFWNYKTECCGASIGIPKKAIQQRLSRKVLEQALEAGAEAVVVACPLCHQNLDLRQKQVNSELGTSFAVPILYVSQVIGLAMGFSVDQMMLDKHLIDGRPLIRRAIARAAQVKAERELKDKAKSEKQRARAEKDATGAQGSGKAETADSAEAGT